MKKICCNNDCDQGRTCPNQKTMNITEIMLKYYFVVSNVPKLLLVITGISLFLP